MKKLFTLFLTIFMLTTLVACSSLPKGTELTLDNYGDYLDIKVRYSASTKGSGKSWDTNHTYTVEVKSKDSSNKFNDVTVTIDNIVAIEDYYMPSIGKTYFKEDAFFDGGDIVVELPVSGHAYGINRSMTSTTAYRGYFNGEIKGFEVTAITGSVSK